MTNLNLKCFDVWFIFAFSKLTNSQLYSAFKPFKSAKKISNITMYNVLLSTLIHYGKL